MRNRDREYAVRIVEQLRADVVDKPEAERKRYGAMAHKLPVLIRTAGLAQALSFVEARGKDEHRLLLRHLGETVGVDDVVARSREADLMEYMWLTRRALEALLWYKRFAQSMLGVEGAEIDDEQTGREVPA